MAQVKGSVLQFGAKIKGFRGNSNEARAAARNPFLESVHKIHFTVVNCSISLRDIPFFAAM